MPDMSILTNVAWFLVVPVLAIAAWCLLPNSSVRKYFKTKHRLQERAAFEDILRQVLQMQQDGKVVSTESLAGTLGKSVPVVRRTISRMTQKDLIVYDNQAVRLTDDGQRWAMHVLRAHRLWESYLADEARLPMTRLHTQAEREEHRLSESDLAALDAQLGHPAEDPHGDPIPTAEGELARPRGTALPQWEGSQFVQVVHVEDEPEDIFKRLLTKGIRPGASLRLVATGPAFLEVTLDGNPVTLEQDLLPNVEVEEDHAALAGDPSLTRLSQIPTGESAEIVFLSEAIRGFSRRRLLDFGVTRGTRIAPVLNNPFGDPRAFRVRGTTIGIRDEQAREIWVRRAASAGTSGGQVA